MQNLGSQLKKLGGGGGPKKLNFFREKRKGGGGGGGVTTNSIFLGIQLDTENMQARLPADKVISLIQGASEIAGQKVMYS